MDTAWLVLRTVGNFYALRSNRETRTSSLQGISGRKPPGSTWPHEAVLSPDKSRICTVHVEHANAAERRALDPCQRFYTVVASVPTSSCLIKMTQGFTLMREARVVRADPRRGGQPAVPLKRTARGILPVLFENEKATHTEVRCDP